MKVPCFPGNSELACCTIVKDDMVEIGSGGKRPDLLHLWYQEPQEYFPEWELTLGSRGIVVRMLETELMRSRIASV